jgi:ribosomal protein L32E
MRRQLEELGLTRSETLKTATQPPSGGYEVLIDEVRTLEKRLQVDEVAHRIAADSRKIQIDFP